MVNLQVKFSDQLPYIPFWEPILAERPEWVLQTARGPPPPAFFSIVFACAFVVFVVLVLVLVVAFALAVVVVVVVVLVACPAVPVWFLALALRNVGCVSAAAGTDVGWAVAAARHNGGLDGAGDISLFRPEQVQGRRGRQGGRRAEGGGG
eukprot:1669528-Rhodomonas_salina.1